MHVYIFGNIFFLDETTQGDLNINGRIILEINLFNRDQGPDASRANLSIKLRNPRAVIDKIK